ncbi:long-chain fatty acid--CoA ligase [Brevibacterium daeguense]|uniref:Long-chain fatty acid--CoA ligase n=1 Tax=Brevibacterium daeguense TaxID=909936 RepID=A0ABP8EFB0_9MICO|nr:AMP-binding protein [Brevibacterium daeguense]
MAMTVQSALRWWSQTAGERDALIFEDDRLNYQLVDTWSSRIARRLHEGGVAKGDRVALKAGNSHIWAVTALGIIKAGAVVVPQNPRLTSAEVAKVLDSADSVALIADSSAEEFAEVADLVPALRTFTLDEMAALRSGAPDDFVVETDEEDMVAVIFTSGSTGTPKGAMLTNRSLMGIVFETTLTEAGFGTGATSLLLLPLAFTPGLVTGLLTSTVLGGTLIIERTIDPARALRLIDEHAVTALFGVPFLWEALSRAPEFERASLVSLKTAWVGGAAVPIPMLEKYAAKGVRLRQIYGCSEAGGVSTATLARESGDHPDSCGIGSVFTDVRVVDANGDECAPGQQGEILLRGPGITPGYYGDPETTAEVLKDGWLCTNDLGVRDEEGRLTFVDRIKDIIISGGINISPIEIEQVIAEIPGVLEVVVIAAPDAKFGETPAAIITVDGDVREADVVAHCEAVLADYKLPRYVIIRDEPLPRLPSGKLAKLEIRDEYADVPGQFEKVR